MIDLSLIPADRFMQNMCIEDLKNSAKKEDKLESSEINTQ